MGTSTPGGVSEIDCSFSNLSAAVKVNASGAGVSNVDLGHIAALANGYYAIVWQETSTSFLADNSGLSIHAKIMDASGGAVGTEFLVNTAKTGDQKNPDILALSNGHFFVAWQTADSGLDQIHGQEFAFDPNFLSSTHVLPVGGEIHVSRSTVGINATPSLTELADGRIAVTWRSPDSSGTGIHEQIIDLRGGVITGFDDHATFFGSADNTSDSIIAQGFYDTLKGLGGDDFLRGGVADDVLDGGTGVDIMIGGDGNDTFLVDNTGDVT